MKVENSILKVILYFDIFNYPVSLSEIRLFLDQYVQEYDLVKALQVLLDEHYIFKLDEFYSAKNDYSLVQKRRICNHKAQDLLKIAYKISAFLYNFPYVRGIGISGSLSKNVADEDADIDFFVITKSNRLWIARTIMHLFKKLTFLVGRQHWFCMNYFVDEDALQIEEKNIFTASELVTLLPICGNGSVKNFFEANDWVYTYYPNQFWRTSYLKNKKSSGWFKRGVEHVLNNRLGDRLDDFFLKLTTNRWNKKEARMKLNRKGGPMSLKTGKHFSKPNPVYFQEKILELYLNKLNKMPGKNMVSN